MKNFDRAIEILEVDRDTLRGFVKASRNYLAVIGDDGMDRTEELENIKNAENEANRLDAAIVILKAEAL